MSLSTQIYNIMDFDHISVNLCYNTWCLIYKKVSNSNARIKDRDASKPHPTETEIWFEKNYSSLKEPTSPSVSE